MKIEVESLDSAVFDKFDTLIFGEGKVGKTTLASTLPTDMDKILYIGLDPGFLALRGTKIQRTVIPNNKISQATLDKLYEYGLANAGDYAWLFVDGINEAGDRVLEERKKANTNQMKAYDEMYSYMGSWIKAMRDIGNLKKVFTSHIEEEKDDNGRIIKFVPDFPGKAIRKELNRMFDVIMCMRIVHNDDVGKNIRILQCTKDADPRYEVGDRTGCLDSIEPANLSVIINKIESNLPGLKSIVSDKASKMNLVYLAKSNKDVFQLVNDYLKKNGLAKPADLSEAQLKELNHKAKEVIQ